MWKAESVAGASSNYLVTGGTGFIGSALVRRLVRDGHRVKVLDDDSRGARVRIAGLGERCEFVAGDVRDAALVEHMCSGVNAIVHLAGINGTAFFYSKPALVLEVGVKGMMNVIDGALRHGVPDLFVASSSEVYQTPPTIPTDEAVPLSIPDPLNPRYSYAGAKIISELLTLNYGRTHFRRAVVFRPHNVYGPDMGWEHVIPRLALRVRALAREGSGTIRLPIQGTGRETRAFVYIDDMIDGLVRILERGEHRTIYNLGTDEETTIETLAKKIGHYFGRGVEIIPGLAPAGSTPRRGPDISRVRALGYGPRVNLDDGLAVTVRWYDEHAQDVPDVAAVGIA